MPNEVDNKTSRKRSMAQMNAEDAPSATKERIPAERVSWGKYRPYGPDELQYIPIGQKPIFCDDSPALCHQVHAICGRARATTLHLACQPGQNQARPVPTPMFMPVGTKGCLKGISIVELTDDPGLGCPIILANTYHLAIQPSTELVDEMNGCHAFQGLDKIRTETPYNLLTDSGGFQMVSLVKLSQVTEDGVSFENPFRKGDMLLLRPEDSIRHQNNISANIIMALDDVVSSVSEDSERFITATQRTLRWFDRCYEAHAKMQTQNLFPIVQGGLDTSVGGLREQCLEGLRERAQDRKYIIPGYAIGGLAGGEDKDHFWRVVDQCCKALPDDKPRYLMGVGYPLDLVVCTALGCDMYDCVYPTRTARFGVALVPGASPGTLRIKQHDCASDESVIQEDCGCQACRMRISRARLHVLLKANNPLAVELISQHNIAFMMNLVKDMRTAILEQRFDKFVVDYMLAYYPDGKYDKWVKDALREAGIKLPTCSS